MKKILMALLAIPAADATAAGETTICGWLDDSSKYELTLELKPGNIGLASVLGSIDEFVSAVPHCAGCRAEKRKRHLISGVVQMGGDWSDLLNANAYPGFLQVDGEAANLLVNQVTGAALLTARSAGGTSYSFPWFESCFTL